ncbi:MAG: hypothetical protein ACYSSP_09845, partial [Planctomycetota bacterium]
MKRHGGVEKGNCGIACLVVVLVILSPSIVSADYIAAVSTATEITDLSGAPEGVELGWYLYEISLEWDFTTAHKGLSNWTLDLKPDCLSEDHIIIFPIFGGLSTGMGYTEEPPDDTFTVEYIGLLEEGGGSPFIKYEEYNWDSDPLGLGDDP